MCLGGRGSRSQSPTSNCPRTSSSIHPPPRYSPAHLVPAFPVEPTFWNPYVKKRYRGLAQGSYPKSQIRPRTASETHKRRKRPPGKRRRRQQRKVGPPVCVKVSDYGISEHEGNRRWEFEVTHKKVTSRQGETRTMEGPRPLDRCRGRKQPRPSLGTYKDQPAEYTAKEGDSHLTEMAKQEQMTRCRSLLPLANNVDKRPYGLRQETANVPSTGNNSSSTGPNPPLYSLFSASFASCGIMKQVTIGKGSRTIHDCCIKSSPPLYSMFPPATTPPAVLRVPSFSSVRDQVCWVSGRTEATEIKAGTKCRVRPGNGSRERDVRNEEEGSRHRRPSGIQISRGRRRSNRRR
ncbi:hypothetical protein C8F01DRAFT_1171417 [Mycena amicta]|nr:hypothetical protein C8F01DRAFT_1171417 [Mycena amicta]